MIALRWIDGRVEPVTWDRERWLERIGEPMPLDLGLRSRRERRRIARADTHGRRGARPVTRWRGPTFQRYDTITWIAHLLSDGRRGVRLYLRDGEDPTPEACRAVDRWLRK